MDVVVRKLRFDLFGGKYCAYFGDLPQAGCCGNAISGHSSTAFHLNGDGRLFLVCHNFIYWLPIAYYW